MAKSRAECVAELAAFKEQYVDAPRRVMEHAHNIEKNYNTPNRKMAIIQCLQKIWGLL